LNGLCKKSILMTKAKFRFSTSGTSEMVYLQNHSFCHFFSLRWISHLIFTCLPIVWYTALS
jgi:hypothetical protein